MNNKVEGYNKRLVVAEHFYSIQGEGKYQGTPAVFFRLGGCNLLCRLENGYTFNCDTETIWKNGKSKEIWEIIKLFYELNYLNYLHLGAHLVITGGEPLLQQKNLIPFIKWLSRELKFKPFIEIETNGTIEPLLELQSLIDIFNISPKINNEIDLLSFDPTILPNDYILKFVINNSEELLPIKNIQECYKIPDKNIFLMPGCETKEELNNKLPTIAEIAKDNCYNLSNRLHLQIWNKATGV